ncbi:helix-turn-helix domain-containing protein [Enterococcus sp. DIV1298c]|uniref:helix-turn-helix domain-containing protein n=1 Tax=Enterococcus sp. DIV1298c TaxID=2815328 RepID=UPI001A927C7A|nr:helix-turn-helix domain-containing protein [Enterococcus sp. DIV1298c]MBO0462377.1 helix-turn-helix domain-containing protein [Enterococcus sp. DIV1298c]
MRDLQIKFITNTVTRRWMRILSVIEQEKKFTIAGLAERVDTSNRTIIKDIAKLKKYFFNIAEFIPKNTGYIFKEIDRVLYREKKTLLLEEELWFEVIGNIFWGDLENLANLADYYHYSESQIQRFFLQVEPIFTDYGIRLTQNPVNLTGKEVNIRKFFYDFFYEGEQTPYTVYPPEGLHEIVLSHLSNDLGNYEIDTGAMAQSFYYYLFISMIRSSQKQFIELPQIVRQMIFDHKRDFVLLESLIPLIKKEYGINLSKDEVIGIHLLIASQRTSDNLVAEKLFYERFNQWPQITVLVNDFIKEEQILNQGKQEI